MIPEGVTAISFDIWKTLIAGNSAFTWPRLELVFGHVGILDYGKEAIVSSYKRADAHFNREAELTGYDSGMAERIGFVLSELGATTKAVPGNDEILDLQKRSGELRILPKYLPALTEPGHVHTLRKLKEAGYKLGTLSNTGMGDCHTVRPVLAHYGLDRLLDVMLFSCEDGRAKPNPGLFKDMASTLGVAPEQVLHVGDNPYADGLAVAAGMHAVLYAQDGVSKDYGIPAIASMSELIRKE